MSLYNLEADPTESNNLAASHPELVAEMQGKINQVAKGAARPLFLIDQFKVVMFNMNGEPLLPTAEGFGEVEHH